MVSTTLRYRLTVRADTSMPRTPAPLIGVLSDRCLGNRIFDTRVRYGSIVLKDSIFLRAEIFAKCDLTADSR